MQTQFVERIKQIDHLIKIKGTGTPAQLAARVRISERSIYLHLNFMRHFGAPIKFDNYRQSYYYENDGQFVMSFVQATKTDEHNRY